MAVKRDVRKELEERTKKDVFNYLKKSFNFLFGVDKKRFILIMIFETMRVVAPIVILFLLQDIINDAVLGVFNVYALSAWGIVMLIQFVLGHISNILSSKYEYEVRRTAEKELYCKKTQLRIEDFENKELRNNSERADHAIFQFMRLFGTGKAVIFDVVGVISYILIIVIWNPLFLPFLLIVPAINILRTSKVLKENYIKRWEMIEDRRKNNYYSYLLYKFETLKEVKVLNVNDNYLNKFTTSLDEILDKEIDLDKSYVRQQDKVRLIDKFFNIGYMVYLVANVVNGSILIGNFNTYRSSFSSISSYTYHITRRLLQINIMLVEIKEYFGFIEYDNDYIDGEIKLKHLDSIEFKNVAYQYKSKKEAAIKNINFKISKGEKIAFIGENGSGKTTVMNLIMKIYEPTKGKILLNGINLKEYTTKSVRENITMLMQEFSQYEESVKENITLGAEAASAQAVYNKIPFSEFKKEIQKLDKKLNTILGTWFADGVAFSKGQTQKLALSRIFYKNVDCYILDEPNSALDPRSERRLFEYIKDKMKHKMCILTLHVFTNIDVMDRVIMFEKGEIIAEGHHEELYAMSKDYKEFYNLQERSLEEETKK